MTLILSAIYQKRLLTRHFKTVSQSVAEKLLKFYLSFSTATKSSISIKWNVLSMAIIVQLSPQFFIHLTPVCSETRTLIKLVMCVWLVIPVLWFFLILPLIYQLIKQHKKCFLLIFISLGEKGWSIGLNGSSFLYLTQHSKQQHMPTIRGRFFLLACLLASSGKVRKQGICWMRIMWLVRGELLVSVCV